MRTKIYTSAFFGLLAVVLLIGQGNYQNMSAGYTDAPGEGQCGDCHTPQVIGLIGGVVVDGLPNLVFPNQTYPLQVKVYDSDGSVQPENGGFMLTALNASNNASGTLSGASQYTKLFSSGGRNYATHKTAQSFFGITDIDTVYYGFNWKAPSSGQTQTITFYYAAVLGNNTGTPTAANDRVFTETATVTFVAPLVVGNISQQTQINCFGQNTGALTVNPSNGLAPYAYAWSNGATGKTAGNLSAGTYTVTVTDAAGQTGTASSTLTQPSQLNLSITGTQQITCFGGSNGQITTLSSGGTPPYTYAWSSGQTGSILSNVPAGAYTVTITDNKGCTKMQSATLTQPGQLLINVVSVMDAYSGQNIGSIDIAVTGGVSGYTYHWTGPNGFTAFSQDLTDLAAGTYFVTATDQNGCTQVVPGGIVVGLLSAVDEVLAAGTQLYPNPANQTVTISLPAIYQGWRVQVFDMQGKLWLERENQWAAGICTLDVSGLPNGVFGVKISTRDGKMLGKTLRVGK